MAARGVRGRGGRAQRYVTPDVFQESIRGLQQQILSW